MAISEIIYPNGSRKFYDEKGNRVLETDQLGRNTRWLYDDQGHLIKETKPEGLETEYLYDEAGDLVCVRDNGGREKLLTYDARGNRTYEEQIIRSGIEAGENAGQEEVSPVLKKIRYSYDREGRLVKKSELIHSC